MLSVGVEVASVQVDRVRMITELPAVASGRTVGHVQLTAQTRALLI